MNGISISFKENERFDQEIKDRLNTISEKISIKCSSKDDIQTIFFHLGKINESKLLELFDYLKGISKDVLVSLWGVLRMDKDDKFIQYGFYYNKIKCDNNFLSFPDPSKIHIDYVRRDRDKVFAIYKNEILKVNAGKIIDSFNVRVFLKNGDYNLSVGGVMSVHELPDKIISVLRISRGFDTWPGIHLSVHGSNLDQVKKAIKREYEKKGYVVDKIEIKK